MLRGPVEAVIFDMDGLLIDSEAIYIEAMQTAARAVGREMALEFCHSMVGVPGHECNLMIQELYGAGFDLKEFRGHVSTHVRRSMEADLPVKPGAVELLDWLDERRLPRAVASSAHRATIEHHLGRAGLLSRFTAYAGRDDVARAKPHPDVYLEAARRLNAAPARCVAFEDSSIGLMAAHAAGMQAFIVPDILQPTPEARAKCRAVLPDLHKAREILQRALPA
jgi:HAD superfamily hydrolase (TIGR01509 family)